jgi:hypothetical protein
MKKLFLLSLLTICFKTYGNIYADSISSKKSVRKNLMEFGGSAAWFFNKYPIDYNSEGWIGVVAYSDGNHLTHYSILL